MPEPLINPRPDLPRLRAAFHIEQAREHLHQALSQLEIHCEQDQDFEADLQNTINELKTMAENGLPWICGDRS